MISRRPDNTFAYYYAQGTEHHSYEVFGAHRARQDGSDGYRMCVYAPHALSVQAVGDFNNWDGAGYDMKPGSPGSGIWEIFIPHAKAGQNYKFAVLGADHVRRMKADPYGRACQLRSDSASVLTEEDNFAWTDEEYRKNQAISRPCPVNIYEVHLFSWLQVCSDHSGIRLEQVGEQLALYAHHMHYTHIELLPLSEHPLDDSWGYQATSYYALTGRIAHPRLFKAFVNRCHELGIGVILDWVPGHFCKDEQGLQNFDGTDLYGWEGHPHWGTTRFDFSRGHVRSFLQSCAEYWISEYHLDGLRTDGVASMIDLNFARQHEPPRYNENGEGTDLNAIGFLREVNLSLHERHPGVILYAEDSSTFPGITAPVDEGGLGFDYKWDMGWMHDTLDYFQIPPFFRCHDHHKLTFSMTYAFRENYLLCLSHDEVVHGKRSLIGRMPGSYDEQFAQMRLLMTRMMTHPGKKLSFMGNEFGQFIEWRFYEPLEFFLLRYPRHAELWRYNRELNQLYQTRRELWESDHSWEGFEWVQADNARDSVYVYLRRDNAGHELMIVLNMANVTHDAFSVGLKKEGTYREILNSDAYSYGGGHRLNGQVLSTVSEMTDGQPHTLRLLLPGLSAVILEKIND